MQVHRHAASVVGHLQRTVLVQHHVDTGRIAGDGLVDTVVDNFLGEMVGPFGLGVHARALAHRLKSREDFDGFCGIGGT